MGGQSSVPQQTSFAPMPTQPGATTLRRQNAMTPRNYGKTNALYRQNAMQPVQPLQRQNAMKPTKTGFWGGKKNKNKKNGGAVALNGAPVNYASPMYQPTPAVANWAVTAGLPTPTKGMGNVAHGGKRKTRRHNKSKAHSKKSKRNKNKKNH
jgi:hypothetical protein